MDLFAPLDNYCERTGPEFWSEPLNAFSNLAFVLAGILVLRMAKDKGLRVFGGLVVLVGFGSATFHTFATGWAMLADVIPIGICLIWFIWAYLRCAAGLGHLATWGSLVAFGAVSAALAAYTAPAWVNETHQYLGALLALLILSVVRQEARRPLACTTVTFAVSMTLRTLDPAICDGWPYGTHFLWHSLNGLAFFFAAQAYVATRAFSIGRHPELS